MHKLLTKITSNTLMRGSAIVFVGSMISNIGSYLYHLFAGRILGPVGYGELSSLISLLYIFGVPMVVLQTVLTKYFSECKAGNARGEAKDLYFRMVKILVKITCISCIVFIMLIPLLGSFLNLTTPRSLLWIFLIFVVSIFTAVNLSVLQGFQLFLWVSVFSSVGMFLKFSISTPLAWFGVEWTMIGTGLAAFITLGLLYFPMRFIFTAARKPFPLTKKSLILFSIPTFISLLGLTSLYSMDIVLVRHFLTPQEAGLYSAIATLGKVIFYASSAIVTVLFPVLSERSVKKEPIGKIFVVALGLVCAISIGITFIYFIKPALVIHLLFGSSYSGAALYLGYFASFISLYSLGNVFVLACLAINRLSIWFITVCAAITQIVFISFFHHSIMEVISVNIGVTFLFAVSAFLYYMYSKTSSIQSA
ncbi:MAG: Capsular polysaccharide biosynthesis protein [Microgenomates group bacterium GW2011_GWC1_43_11]|uniref:Capsular polysaccharide biosynthesis protein n=1 Tax=Candidatus Gottesmanbacteria bacterium GW2011_GWA1_44_24b TaxID=1618437 RepID=A0A0G1IQJ2_9BACT|nr:MAG: Capsular polysaccharide biosynthesis protein [Microgenomates group bacterium GW2011_GWC1_43_11]KKT61611.1 MAG: Capsular polysaccharide biosynthesis protein [Candidatus Gottesmanbacteria bacterium GW2011_GWA1_44_24b]HCM82192.1 hypothetical protein [Patescibacteria group bacterium]